MILYALLFINKDTVYPIIGLPLGYISFFQVQSNKDIENYDIHINLN